MSNAYRGIAALACGLAIGLAGCSQKTPESDRKGQASAGASSSSSAVKAAQGSGRSSGDPLAGFPPGMSRASPMVGKKAPDFTLASDAGQPVALKSLLQQGPVFIYFYKGSWCMNCSAHLQQFQNVKARFDAAHVQLVAISVDDASISKGIRQKMQLTYPLLCDPVSEHQVGDAYGVYHAPSNFDVPAVFLIDKTGTIRMGRVGEPHAPFDAGLDEAALQMVKDKKLS